MVTGSQWRKQREIRIHLDLPLVSSGSQHYAQGLYKRTCGHNIDGSGVKMSEVYAYEISDAMRRLKRAEENYSEYRSYTNDDEELRRAFVEFAKLVAKANQEESK